MVGNVNYWNMVTQNMVGGWSIDAIVLGLVPFKFDGFSTQ